MFKRLAALTMSAVMAVGMMAPAFAAESHIRDTDMPSEMGEGGESLNPYVQSGEEGSFTITQVQDGATYTAYQMFAVATQADADGKTFYQYFVEDNTIWYDFIKGPGKEYVKFLASKQEITYTQTGETVTGTAVAWKEYKEDEEVQKEQDAAKFAELALEYYAKNSAGKDEAYLGRQKSAFRSGSGGGLRDDMEDMMVFSLQGLRPAGSSDSLTISYLPLGYYLVDSTVGSLCALTTAAPQARIEDKNQEGAIDKRIWTDKTAPSENDYMSDTNWGKVTDAPVGSDLYYRITITPGKGTEDKNLVLRDRMGRITVKYDTMKVYLVSDNGKTELTKGTDYRLYQNNDYTWYAMDHTKTMGDEWARINQIEHLVLVGESRAAIAEASGKDLDYVNKVLDESYNFGLIFKNREWTGSEKLVICYRAGMDYDAYLGSGFNTAMQAINAQGIVAPHEFHTNETYLGVADMTAGEFDELISDTGNKELPGFKDDKWKSSKAEVHCYGFELAKTDGDNILLENAKFELRTDPEDPETAIKLVQLQIVGLNSKNMTMQGGNRVKEVFPQNGVAYSIAPEGAANATTEIVAGYATIVGLDSGTYYIVETDAPDGYNKMMQPQEIRLISVSEVFHEEPGMSEASIFGQTAAFANMAPIQVNGKGYDLSKFGYPDHCTTAHSMWTLQDGRYLYGNTQQKLQIGSTGDGAFGGDGTTMVEGGVHLVNLTGAELPHTGGIGTTIFYVVGGALVVGAGILLIVKKRMNSDSDSEK